MATESPSTSPDNEYTRVPTAKPLLQTSSSRCTQCNVRPRENGRNLVVCIDGTCNKFGPNDTNVVKLFHKIDQETTPGQTEQFVYYLRGIGTRLGSLHIFNRVGNIIDMAVARSMGENIKEAYDWLARKYQDGDQIYLFGFSRGAYQVRVLAAMIYEVGLIRMPTKDRIEEAYHNYIRSGKSQTSQLAREFKVNARVHFVGVWDTVSSVGPTRGDVVPSSAAHACHFRHALALDELRVKFMPEYFYAGVDSQTDDGRFEYIGIPPDAGHFVISTSERGESTVSNNDTESSEGEKTSDIKEVWFAGSHSDVGGMNRPGKSHQAGNVSLLWIRREAAANGLVLKPTDIVWIPDDIDFGMSNSMTVFWRVMEYIPIKYQVSVRRAGEDAVGLHKLKPRHIIPGQKVHASVLYANAYKPKATLGEGFDIPIIQSGLEDAELDSQTWEMGLFDDTAAQEVVTYLCTSSWREVAPIYLDRLLFMLRFKEGKQFVRNVPDWETRFMNVIRNRRRAQFVRLMTIVAYFETSCDPESHPTSPVPPRIELSQDIFNDARKYLGTILATHKHRHGPRIVALLRPMTKHQILRERILTLDVLETLVKLLDGIVTRPGDYFVQAMDGLNCLLQYEDTRQTLVEKLGANPPNFNVSRLSRILKVDDPLLLTAALRMVSTLARIPEARTVCSIVKPRIRELAGKDERFVGLLAVEIWLALYDPSDHPLNIRDAHVRANLASALVRLSPDRYDSGNDQGGYANPGQQIMSRIFGPDITTLCESMKKIIVELKKAVQKGNARERTGATMTFLKLCEVVIIRTYLREINLLGVFVSQLQHKETALLAAHALATCLTYSDMKESIKDNEDIPRRIVDMLKRDYFDDAVGPIEGFQIFGDLMQHADLREKTKNYNVTEVLNAKLEAGKLTEIRTSQAYSEILKLFGM